MAYRNKTYVCFDGDNDMSYYRLMTAWAANDKFEFDFSNAHDLNTARDTSQEESIKRQLRIRLANSKDFIVLIGKNTKSLRKFVPWEMEVALNLGLPIVGVNINGTRHRDDLCPATIMDKLAMYVSFNEKIMTYAMKNWPAQHTTLTKQGVSGPYYYNAEIYRGLGL
jgi:hypothetical protein